MLKIWDLVSYAKKDSKCGNAVVVIDVVVIVELSQAFADYSQ